MENECSPEGDTGEPVEIDKQFKSQESDDLVGAHVEVQISELDKEMLAALTEISLQTVADFLVKYYSFKIGEIVDKVEFSEIDARTSSFPLIKLKKKEGGIVIAVRLEMWVTKDLDKRRLRIKQVLVSPFERIQVKIQFTDEDEDEDEDFELSFPELSSHFLVEFFRKEFGAVNKDSIDRD